MRQKISIGVKKYPLGYKGYVKIEWSEFIQRELDGTFFIHEKDALKQASRNREDLLAANNINIQKNQFSTIFVNR